MGREVLSQAAAAPAGAGRQLEAEQRSEAMVRSSGSRTDQPAPTCGPASHGSNGIPPESAGHPVASGRQARYDAGETSTGTGVAIAWAWTPMRTACGVREPG